MPKKRSTRPSLAGRAWQRSILNLLPISLWTKGLWVACAFSLFPSFCGQALAGAPLGTRTNRPLFLPCDAVGALPRGPSRPQGGAVFGKVLPRPCRKLQSAKVFRKKKNFAKASGVGKVLPRPGLRFTLLCGKAILNGGGFVRQSPSGSYSFTREMPSLFGNCTGVHPVGQGKGMRRPMPSRISGCHKGADHPPSWRRCGPSARTGPSGRRRPGTACPAARKSPSPGSRPRPAPS